MTDKIDNGKNDCVELMNSAIQLAKTMLLDSGEFLPYGEAMQSNNEIVSFGATNGLEHPKSSELIAILKDEYVSKAKEYKATALVYDVSLKESDAIAINLDHELGYSVVVIHPYVKTDNEITYGDIFVNAGENNVFT